MRFTKNLSSGYRITSLKFKSFFSGIKLKRIAVLILTITLSSCNPIALVNPESYSSKWENTYLWFEPGEMTTIYISDSGDPATAEPIPNDSDFLIEWKEKGPVYNLKVTSYYQDIDYAWFTGYDTDNPSEEIPWVQEGNTIELESSKLRELAEGGMYQISISDDLKD